MPETKTEQLFRLKVGSKRQLTFPPALLESLKMSEGDEIQILVQNGQVVSMQPCKAVPTLYLSEATLSKLQEREQALLGGQGVDVKDLLANAGSSVG